MSDFEKKILVFKDKIESSKDTKQLSFLNDEIFGKSGIINLEFKKLGSLTFDEKKNFAANINKKILVIF